MGEHHRHQEKHQNNRKVIAKPWKAWGEWHCVGVLFGLWRNQFVHPLVSLARSNEQLRKWPSCKRYWDQIEAKWRKDVYLVWSSLFSFFLCKKNNIAKKLCCVSFPFLLISLFFQQFVSRRLSFRHCIFLLCSL